MVCNRCIMVVKNELQKLAIKPQNITLGEVTLDKPLSRTQKDEVSKVMIGLGFELISDKKSQIIEQIKTRIIQQVQNPDKSLTKQNLSHTLSESTHHDYGYLSNLFSEVEGVTIEKYYIAQKIEKVKELLVYDELSLNEIADRLGYSSTAYLSNQFKKITGLTPSHFKKIKINKRKPLDEV